MIGSDSRTSSSMRGLDSKKKKLILRLVLIGCACLFVAIISFITYKVVDKYINKKESVAAMNACWEKYDYEQCYEIATNIIEKSPLQNAARTLRGYSAFYMGISQTDTTIATEYIDEAIRDLRIALLGAQDEVTPQINYMLGKAYFYKNRISAYGYYSDLVIKYLTLCQEQGYTTNEIPEFLGLSYADLDMTKESIAAFTEALAIRESDMLLLSIADQYCKNNQETVAKQYLFRVLKISEDETIITKCQNLLGQIYIDEGSYDDAKAEFESILEKNENSADAHYGLGVLYEKQGDMAKARSEWRKTLKIEPKHPGASLKMTETK